MKSVLKASFLFLIRTRFANGYSVPANHRRQLLFSTAAVVPTVLVNGGIPAAWGIVDVQETQSALRILKTCRNKIASESFQVYISEGDYQSLQQVLRVPPISNVRKASSTIVKVNPESEVVYRNFANQLEQLDNLARLADRGKNVSTVELLSQYDAMVTALGDFVSMAASSVSVEL